MIIVLLLSNRLRTKVISVAIFPVNLGQLVTRDCQSPMIPILSILIWNSPYPLWYKCSKSSLNILSARFPQILSSYIAWARCWVTDWFVTISANVLMKTVLNVVYAVVGLIGLFIFVVAIVCISVHIYHCCSRHRRKQSDAVGDTCSRPSASSTAVDCQYVTLQTADGTAVPTAPPHTQLTSRESVELQPFACPGNGHSDVKPPSYDEVMGYRWACCYVTPTSECVLVVRRLAWSYCAEMSYHHLLVLSADVDTV